MLYYRHFSNNHRFFLVPTSHSLLDEKRWEDGWGEEERYIGPLNKANTRFIVYKERIEVVLSIINPVVVLVVGIDLDGFLGISGMDW